MNSSELKPILCGTDFSEGAGLAATVAGALAQRWEAPLLLVRSVDERGEFPLAVRTRLMEGDLPRLAEEAARLRDRGLTVEEQLLSGVPDDGVADFARNRQARLVVVGASGSGSLWAGRWLLGNTAERIAETSPAPTLVVRSAEPLLAWLRGERPLTVFLATDFTETSEAALRWLAEWRRLGPCDITLGYVHRPPEERGEFAVLDGLGLTRLTTKVREELERDLQGKARRLLGSVPTIRVVPGSARVDAHLIALATEAQADLFVLGTHQWKDLQRVWHTSISRRILHHAPMNIACVPVPAVPQGAAAAIPSFSRVLVATDFSETANRAIPYACAALAREGTICLFHAAPAGEADEPAKRAALDAKLRALIPVETGKRGVQTEVRIVQGDDAAKAIGEAAERFGADVICIGSHGRTGLGAALLGSVARAVIDHSRRPVLLIRPPQ